MDNPKHEWFAMLTISITEANINAPRFSSVQYEVTKTELEPVDSILLTTTATDSDFVSTHNINIVVADVHAPGPSAQEYAKSVKSEWLVPVSYNGVIGMFRYLPWYDSGFVTKTYL